jgi:hypothetical protein
MLRRADRMMAALDDALRNDIMQKYFSQGMIQQAIQPLLGMESFTAAPAAIPAPALPAP